MVGNVRCEDEQGSSYVTLVKKAYGHDVRNWTPAVVSDMGHLIGKDLPGVCAGKNDSNSSSSRSSGG